MSVEQAYAKFIEQSLAWYSAQGIGMQTWRDPAQVSPCEVSQLNDEQVSWQPVPQQPAADFSNVELALELELHPDIKAFYSSWFGANLAAEHTKGKLALLMPWHAADIARLQENIIGHILMKRRLRQQATVFFAVTDDENIMLSVLNSSGEVFQESVGQEVKVKLADNLAAFLAELKPLAYSPLFD